MHGVGFRKVIDFFYSKRSIHRSNVTTEHVRDRVYDDAYWLGVARSYRKPKRFKITSLYEKGMEFSEDDLMYILSRFRTCDNYHNAVAFCAGVEAYKDTLPLKMMDEFFAVAKIYLTRLKASALELARSDNDRHKINLLEGKMLKNILSVAVMVDNIVQVSDDVCIGQAETSVKQKKKKSKRKPLEIYLNKGLNFTWDDEEYVVSRVKVCTDLNSAEKIYYKVLEYEGKVSEPQFQVMLRAMKCAMQVLYNDEYESKLARTQRKKNKKAVKKGKECDISDPSVVDSFDLDIAGTVSDSGSNVSKSANANLVSDFFRANKKGTNIVNKGN